MATHWGYVRSTRDFPNNWGDVAGHGFSGVLFNPDEQPSADLVNAYNAAQKSGLQTGLWAAPQPNESAQHFAQRVADLSRQYNPSLFSLDIEFPGKGYAGSPGWQYDQEVAQALAQLAPSQHWAVAPMGMQSDFNYAAFEKYLNNPIWMPQAYGANPATDRFDPQKINDVLIAAGIDPSRIQTVIAPGQDFPGIQNASVFTIDDLNGRYPNWAAAGPPGTPPPVTPHPIAPPPRSAGLNPLINYLIQRQSAPGYRAY